MLNDEIEIVQFKKNKKKNSRWLLNLITLIINPGVAL
jgi:hypothetical protein